MTAGLLVLIGVLLAAMLLRMPIGISMIAPGIAHLLIKRQDVGLVAKQIGNGLYNRLVLLTVPLFVFAANLMNADSVSERLFDLCLILVSVIFLGMSGSAIADAAGPGLVIILRC